MNHQLFLFLLFTLFHFYGFAQIKVNLNPSKSEYRIGDPLTLNINEFSSLKKGSWVGLYPAEAPHKVQGFLTYKYIRSTQLNFVAPDKKGKYEFRVFDGDPGTEIKAIPFTVTGIDPREINLSILTSEIKPTKAFEVKMESKLTFNPKAWLGIYLADADIKIISGYKSFKYVGAMKDKIFTMTAPIEPGNYELRFFNADPGILIKRVPFRVGELDLSGMSVTLNKAEYGPEEDIIIQYVGHKDLTNRAWLGLFKPKAETYREYLDYRYLFPITKGTVTIKAPPEKGSYEVKMFYADQGPMLLEPVPFSVSSSLDKNYLEDKIEKEGKVVLYGIYFDTDKSTVKAESYALVEQIAQLLLADPNLKIRIEGHTDSQGEESYNQSLSERRCKAVLDLLTSKYKVPSTQLESVGHGESKPIDNNNTPNGRAKNRRVELVKI